MENRIVLFEDEGFKNLHPIALNRPVYDLRCGIMTMEEKVRYFYPRANYAYHTRDYLAPLVSQQKETEHVNKNTSEQTLFINGRVVWDEELTRQVTLDGPEQVFMKEGTVVAARLSPQHAGAIDLSAAIKSEAFNNLPKTGVDATVVAYSWEIVYQNKKELVNDMRRLGCNGSKEGRLYDGAYLLEPDQVTIASGAKIKPCAVIDAEEGPVFIDEGVEVMPQTYIKGPCFVGRNSKIKCGAKIYGGTSIGEVCKVGGEVEESIFHSYSNKQHDGFIGHSYIGKWVNIGADTNNSDLKNNYGEVKCFVNGEPVLTGHQFLGLSMGDHSKTGINTMCNTGTIIGVCCNLFGPGFLPKFIPSFSWGGTHRLVEYNVEKCLEVAARVMQRRNCVLTSEECDVLRHIFAMEAQRRVNFYILMQ